MTTAVRRTRLILPTKTCVRRTIQIKKSSEVIRELARSTTVSALPCVSVLTLRASTRCNLRLALSMSSVRSLFILFFFCSRAESVCELVRVGKTNVYPQSRSATRCMPLCSLSAVSLCNKYYTFRTSCWTLPHSPLITVYHHQLALQRNFPPYPLVVIDLDLEPVPRFEDMHRGHRSRECHF